MSFINTINKTGEYLQSIAVECIKPLNTIVSTRVGLIRASNFLIKIFENMGLYFDPSKISPHLADLEKKINVVRSFVGPVGVICSLYNILISKKELVEEWMDVASWTFYGSKMFVAFMKNFFNVTIKVFLVTLEPLSVIADTFSGIANSIRIFKGVKVIQKREHQKEKRIFWKALSQAVQNRDGKALEELKNEAIQIKNHLDPNSSDKKKDHWKSYVRDLQSGHFQKVLNKKERRLKAKYEFKLTNYKIQLNTVLNPTEKKKIAQKVITAEAYIEGIKKKKIVQIFDHKINKADAKKYNGENVRNSNIRSLVSNIISITAGILATIAVFSTLINPYVVLGVGLAAATVSLGVFVYNFTYVKDKELPNVTTHLALAG